jgi:hypothetical protein
MGIIQGFLGGVGKGMADGGKMQFAANLQKERDEADFLKRQSLAQDERSYRTGEREAGEDTAASVQETKVETDADAALLKEKGLDKRANIAADGASGGNKPTAQIKNARYLMSKEGGSKSLKDAISASFPNAKVKHTDEDGNISVAVLGDDGFENLFSFVQNDQGQLEVVKPGQTATRTKPTKAERQTAADELNAEQDNNFAWTRVGANSPEAKARAAEKLSGPTNQEPKPTGLVGSQQPVVDSPATKPVTKKIGSKQMDMEGYIKKMLNNYPNATREELIEQWDKK